MKTILCYGDSNTYGYNPVSRLRYPRDVRWPGYLQKLLGESYYVIEEGCNGRTTVFAQEKEPWKRGDDYLKPCLNSHKPVDYVIVMLGSNDLKREFRASARSIACGAEKLVRIIKEFTKEKQGFCPEILLISPPEIGEEIIYSPFRMSFDESAVGRSRELSALYKKIAEKHGCLFLDAASIISPSKEDSLHLSPEAHKKLAEEIKKIITS